MSSGKDRWIKICPNCASTNLTINSNSITVLDQCQDCNYSAGSFTKIKMADISKFRFHLKKKTKREGEKIIKENENWIKVCPKCGGTDLNIVPYYSPGEGQCSSCLFSSLNFPEIDPIDLAEFRKNLDKLPKLEHQNYPFMNSNLFVFFLILAIGFLGIIIYLLMSHYFA